MIAISLISHQNTFLLIKFADDAVAGRIPQGRKFVVIYEGLNYILRDTEFGPEKTPEEAEVLESTPGFQREEVIRRQIVDRMFLKVANALSQRDYLIVVEHFVSGRYPLEELAETFAAHNPDLSVKYINDGLFHYAAAFTSWNEH